ncbi:MAG: XdhC family protein, partial [Nitrososphaerales archaeon]
RLVLIGQGGKDDVEDGLVRLGKMMGYESAVIDHLPVLSDEPDQLITDLDYDLSRFPFLPTDSVVVLTKGERDAETLEVLSRAGVRFVGLLASMQRARDTLATLRTRGVPEPFLQSVHTPIGLDIGAVSPEEICVAIMGDVTATKRGRHLPHGALASQAPPRVAT